MRPTGWNSRTVDSLHESNVQRCGFLPVPIDASILLLLNISLQWPVNNCFNIAFTRYGVR